MVVLGSLRRAAIPGVDCRRFLARPARPWAAYADLAVLFAELWYWTFAVVRADNALYAAKAAGRNRVMAATAQAA